MHIYLGLSRWFVFVCCIFCSFTHCLHVHTCARLIMMKCLRLTVYKGINNCFMLPLSGGLLLVLGVSWHAQNSLVHFPIPSLHYTHTKYSTHLCKYWHKMFTFLANPYPYCFFGVKQDLTWVLSMYLYIFRTLYWKSDLNISRKETVRPCSQFLLSCICQRFIYSQDWSAK
jgi:hypothetical protein